MGMGATGGMPRSVILAQAKREIAQLEGRLGVTQKSISRLEEALHVPETSDRLVVIESVLMGILDVQLTTLKGHLQEGTTQLEQMKAGVAREESLVKPASSNPIPPSHRRQ